MVLDRSFFFLLNLALASASSVSSVTFAADAVLTVKAKAAAIERQEPVPSKSFAARKTNDFRVPEIATVYLSVQRRFDNIGASRQEGSAWTAGFQHRDHGSVPKMIKAAGGSHWSVYFGDADVQKVKQAQALGLKVLVWTVNDPIVMGRMLDMGVDGLISDRPDLAVELLKRRGIRWR